MGPPAARCLDLTRLVSRAGRVLTGVDRVELAYLDALIADPVPAFGLVRTALGDVLTDAPGMAAVARAARSGNWGAPDLLGRLARLDPPRAAAQALVRAHAVGRCLPAGLGRMLRRRLPDGTTYLNVGHSNLTDRVLDAVRTLPGARITVLIHDTIPLDHPNWQREGTPAAFAAKLARVADHADLLICTSDVCRAGVARHLGPRLPPVITAHLGVTAATPDPSALPVGLDLSRPWFVTTGTIEPRKNHALLLDVWAALGPHPPRLFIAGSRGWRNDHVFARLDARPPGVTELSGLSDAALAALVQGARALLFPSLAEGFGLPVPESLALGTPAVCGPLAIWREIVGERAVYLDTNAPILWKNTVSEMSATPPPRIAGYVPPGWDTHFKTVLNVT